eukprot:GFYU01004334.1.p1 GENE.GFYU01004334.1~~GFYU01004334.1.p1  ORF type:complete len:473 (-),score=92.45 GFYU01004334.1:70-1398(-)
MPQTRKRTSGASGSGSTKKSKAHTHLLRIRNAAQIVTVSAGSKGFKVGKEMDELNIIENGTIVVGLDGTIEAVGPAADFDGKYDDAVFKTDMAGEGLSIVPGLVDSHTHPVWSGNRVGEFAMKLAGATYLDIHNAGGGIGYTVEQTRKSSESELKGLFAERLARMLNAGTTLAECKSGYGLDTATEVKMLKVIESMKGKQPVDLVSTFCGAHSVPKDKTPAEATKDVIENQIPAVKELMDSGKLTCDNLDVFLEKGVFECDDSKKILEAGKKAGFTLNFHGDELNYMKSGEIGAEFEARAISHLEHVSDDGIKAMAEKSVFGVLLPTTAYVLRLVPPPARKMIDQGVPVCLGSDYNPNAHCLSMPFVMNLACILMKMTMNEALVAATINSAASINREKTHGSLEKGKLGDMVIVGAPRWEHLVYELIDPPVKSVIKKGEIVV